MNQDKTPPETKHPYYRRPSKKNMTTQRDNPSQYASASYKVKKRGNTGDAENGARSSSALKSEHPLQRVNGRDWRKLSSYLSNLRIPCKDSPLSRNFPIRRSPAPRCRSPHAPFDRRPSQASNWMHVQSKSIPQRLYPLMKSSI